MLFKVESYSDKDGGDSYQQEILLARPLFEENESEEQGDSRAEER